MRCVWLAAALALTGCAGGVLDPQGPVGAGERQVLLNALVIMLGIVVPTILATFAFAWWFRAGNARAEHKPDWSYSGRLELLVWSVPALVVIFLGGIAWIGSHDLDPYKPLPASTAPLRVQVVALDWKWLFIYPDQGVASVNRLVVPAGTPVAFSITSATVMNSFFVPQLGGQIYAMAGMETRLHLQADRPGRYRGLSAHYSGKGFPGMRFMVDAVPPRQFAGWLAATRQQGMALDRSAYLALTRDSENVAPYGYRAVAPGLFAAVVRDSGTTTAKRAIQGRGP
ncbi:ubiquinol oxidase subunit II [Sphingomonas hylomeconis]|uniref:Ubiquinol oxidase subunit 2 n=2 Tax=Sphingomonas hylomeconis TaxID=1395958 RepID=A0ABV7SRY7_9SPHN